MNKPIIASICMPFLLSLTSVSVAHAKEQSEPPVEFREQWTALNTSEPKQLARERFNENKYGMFIHWGLYSQVGGVWKGEKMEEGGNGPRVAEWVMRRKGISRAEYAALADTFNPVEFDADEWVAIAKAAGMNYMVITSKHHDGFALFDSQASDFNVAKATPFKRDIIRELEQACKRGGLDFGVYYSHAIDWADGGDGGLKDYAVGERPPFRGFANAWDPAPVTFQDYLENKSLPQIRELLANYDLSEIWFDTPCHILPEQSFEFYTTVYEANPEILVTQRIGNGMGDIGTPGDNKIPEQAIESTWEGIATTNHSWGYKSYDDHWKSPMETLFWLLENSSKGGNFLLNVGPMGNGKIPQESVENLLGAGAWLKVNGEAVYGTRNWTTTSEGPGSIKPSKRAGAFEQQVTPQHFWFTCKDDAVYVSVLQRPEGNTVVIQALKDLPIKGIEVLGESGSVEWSNTKEGLSVTLPDFVTTTPGYALKVQL
ncbi:MULTISPECIES: alpha-L-fucosidase [unclassified Lentimonas]|uniref:alpha-L-fucosidase n=1 Tax=unclassified Lentimonas TaxID=2630993 RepID=UPI00138974CD|nr:MULTISPECIES: alpha-L-fucosidase [unclassified Lentimonas]